MLKIIDGKRYNTQTATRVANWDNERSLSDAHHVDETLYVTSKNNWFLHGTGGALSQWAESREGNTTVSGEGIRPITTEEAREWLENKDCFDELEQYFSDSIEDA